MTTPSSSITLNHVGIAVEKPDALSRLFKILGFTKGRVEAVEDQGVQTHFFGTPEIDVHLELLEVIDPEGTVAKFIQKRGPGIHHLSFLVPTGLLDAKCQELVAAGYRLTYPAPKSGAQNMRINFIHPATTGGVLIELMEPAAKT
jgi:methylmalonyl-CoA/ethylmalonyl-CoA epimerase